MKDSKYFVYAHTNKTNGKVYIGITSRETPEQRWNYGFGYVTQPRFNNAIRKYGWDNFEHTVIAGGLSQEAAGLLEKVLIDMLNTRDDRYGYNIVEGGGYGVIGLVHSDESKRKMSIAKKGERHPNYGKHLSDATKEKIGNANRGRHYGDKSKKTDETKRKMSEGKMKPVYMCADDEAHSIIRTFRSAKDAEAELGISRKNISLCCQGKRPRAGGYVWKFA